MASFSLLAVGGDHQCSRLPDDPLGSTQRYRLAKQVDVLILRFLITSAVESIRDASLSSAAPH